MIIYNLFIFLYSAFLRIAAFFHPKAKAFIKGRRNWRGKIRDVVPPTGFDLWLHFASLGEFEQGQTLLQGYREKHPKASILISFFSPSGFQKQKDNPLADHVAYLPIDSKKNAKDWVDLVNPKQVIFIKYEFWFNTLQTLKAKKIDTYLAAAVFHKKHFFNTFPGKHLKSRLNVFKSIFLQESAQFSIPSEIKTFVFGDPRVDRVSNIQESLDASEKLKTWSKNKIVFIWGSVWKEDFPMIKWLINNLDFQQFFHLIAPHDVSKSNVQDLVSTIDSEVDLFSSTTPLKKRVVILDTIGQLSRSYRLGSMAYIGGGFGQGLHNILEPMAAGLPTLFGPKNEGFPEVEKSIAAGCGYQVTELSKFKNKVLELSKKDFPQLKNKTLSFIASQRGATEKILDILEKDVIAREKA